MADTDPKRRNRITMATEWLSVALFVAAAWGAAGWTAAAAVLGLWLAVLSYAAHLRGEQIKAEQPPAPPGSEYRDGQRQAAHRLLGLYLDISGDAGSRERWRSERLQAIQALRSLCRDHGDNDWEDNLHLADVIRKHLGDHLDG